MQPENKNDSISLSTRYQQYAYAKRHLRGTSRPEVFPFGETNPKGVEELTHGAVQSERLYASTGVSPTLDSMQGGMKQPKVVRQPLRFLERNGKKVDGDYSFTVDTSNTGGVKVDSQIRRLTPTECERLQGYPDGWTEWGVKEMGKSKSFASPFHLPNGKEIYQISDTQRYKTLGNSVTVNVIQAIMEKLI